MDKLGKILCQIWLFNDSWKYLGFFQDSTLMLGTCTISCNAIYWFLKNYSKCFKVLQMSRYFDHKIMIYENLGYTLIFSKA